MPFSRRQWAASVFAGSLGLASPWSSSVYGAPARFGARATEHTETSREAVNKGFAWLEKVKVARGGYRVDVGRAEDIGCTAMVGLAMLAEGSTPTKGPNKQKLQEITIFLIKEIESMPQSNITAKTGTQLQRKIGLQAHSFFALLFLTQIAGESHLRERVLEATRKLTQVVAQAQLPNGSWGQKSWAPTLGTVMGWTSLRSAHFAGLDVSGSAEKTAEHLIQGMQQRAKSRHWMHELYKNAAGIRVLYAMQQEEQNVVKAMFQNVLNVVRNGQTAFNQAGGEEYLAFHLITETMLQKGGEDWGIWFPEVRDKTCAVQNADGSWTGHHCITSRTFCTAAACLVLSAPNRYLPISQR